MKLSETGDGKAWIEQFDGEDRPDAAFLLDSLRLISADRFFSSMRQTIAKATRSLREAAALYVVREVSHDEMYFENKRNRPTIIRPSEPVGSEGTVAHLATNVTRGDPARFLNHPPLQTLKSKKVRHILLLDDLVGSGNRIIEFLRAWRRSKTIVSWCSGHFITFHVVAYAISDIAENAIQKEFDRCKGEWPRVKLAFHFAKRPNAVEGRWFDFDRERLMRLCEKYGERAKIRWGDRLGYRKSMAVLVFSHGCPNNVPGIIWATTNNWRGIFPRRAVPDHLLVASRPSHEQHASLGNKKVIESLLAPADGAASILVQILLLIRRRIKGVDRIADILDVTISECEESLGRLRNYRLLDETGKITGYGRAELRRVEREIRIIRERGEQLHRFYVPQQLREARENF